ncbi:MAG: ABC transporter substrate-binding protein [Lachnospiraceae bacterium]|nr:ABC transporter substrate-binding protein [Lachnospiraceae bacterium]
MKKLLAIMLAAVFLMTGCQSTGDTSDAQGGESTTGVTAETESADASTGTLKVARLGTDIKIAPLIIADSQGYYEEEGVKVEFEAVNSLPDGLTAVSEGKLDVLPFGVIPSATYVAQGVDVVVIGGTISEGSECITTEENKDAFTDAESFRGKKVGCFRMETGHMVIKNYLMEAGLELDKDVEFVYLESQAAIMEAVKKGEVDCGFVNSGYGYVCQQSGLAVAFRPGEWVANFPCCRQTTSREALDSKKSDLVKYMIANLRGYETILNDKDTAIADLVAYSGQDEAYVENVIYGTDDYTAAMTISMDPCKTAVCDFYESMKAIGDIDASTTYTMEDHVSTEVYEEALNTLIEREPDNELWTQLMESFKENNE